MRFHRREGPTRHRLPAAQGTAEFEGSSHSVMQLHHGGAADGHADRGCLGVGCLRDQKSGQRVRLAEVILVRTFMLLQSEAPTVRPATPAPGDPVETGGCDSEINYTQTPQDK